MSKNTGKNKKKNKPYYKKQEVSNNKETKVSNSPMSNNTFLLGVGFLIIIYSRYLANQLSSVLVNILGLGVMFYAMFRSFNEDKENGNYRACYNLQHLLVDTTKILVYFIRLSEDFSYC